MRKKHSLNRRQFLGALGAGVGVAGCAGNSTLPDLLPPGMEPSTAPIESGDLAAAREIAAVRGDSERSPVLNNKLTLLKRITYGPRPADFTEIDTLGYAAYLEKQINPELINDSAMAVRLAPFTTLNLDATTIGGMNQIVANELGAAALLRAIHSKRQLFEKMVEFWSDHFNIYQFSNPTWNHKFVDDREVIRPFAMGRFTELLLASAKSPAMLRYLNGDQNRVGSPNENFAREVMELHTVGLSSGYTHHDVQEMARVMTGWTVATSGPNLNRFEFRPEFHDYGPKQVMGLSLPAGGGITDGEQALTYLASHPSTARNIAGKLVAYFISEDRPQSLVDQATARFTITGGDIKATLRIILRENSIVQATPKVKRPFHLLADIARRSLATVLADPVLAQLPSWMGHQQFAWPSPDGYPQRSDFWAPGLLSRWNTINQASFGTLPAIPLYPYYIAQAGNATTPSQIVALWNQKYFDGNMSPGNQQLLMDYINVAPENLLRKYNESFALALSLPAFQYH